MDCVIFKGDNKDPRIHVKGDKKDPIIHGKAFEKWVWLNIIMLMINSLRYLKEKIIVMPLEKIVEKWNLVQKYSDIVKEMVHKMENPPML